MIREIINRIKFFGIKSKCPVCGTKHSGFLKAGLYSKRESAKCPICGSLERHRQLWLILKQQNIHSNANLLHFAPEKCIKTRINNLGILNYNISEYDLNIASDYHFDITNIDLPDEKFNYIICSHVLEHVNNDIESMSEMYRILKKNGILFLQVPIHQDLSKLTYEDDSITTEEERIKHFGQYDHVRIYGLDIEDRLKSVGFKIERIDLTEVVDEKTSLYLGLINHSGVKDFTFKCTKN
jgi:SAM-dependent methyltransferase